MSFEEKIRRAADRLALAVLALAVTSLVSTALGTDPLRLIRFERAPMRPDVALGLLLAAGSLWLQLRPHRRGAALACAFAAAGLAGAALLENIFQAERGIVEFVAQLWSATVPGAVSSRMTTDTAVALLLCSFALIPLPSQSSRIRTRVSLWLTNALIAFALSALVACVLRATMVSAIPLRLGTHAAAAFVLLGVGLLFARPNERIARLIFSSEPVGMLTRRLFFGVAVVPLVLGLTSLFLVDHGLLERVDGLVIFSAGWILSALALTQFSNGLVLHLHDDHEQVEQTRMLFTARLQEQAAQLQEIVGIRTRELHEANLNLRAAADANARLALVAHYTTNSVTITDAAGCVQWVNAAFERLTGYALAEIQGRKPGEFLQGPDTDLATTALIHEARVRGQACHVELLNYTKDRRPFWQTLEIQPVRDAAGQLINFIGIQTDVTAQRVVTARLHELNDRLRLATRSAALGVWEWDVAAHQSNWDDRTLEIQGLTREQFTGTVEQWIGSIHPEDRARAQLDAVIAGDNAFELDYRIFRANDGELRYLQSRAIVQRDPAGRLLRLTGTERDVTAEREAIGRTEALNERLRLALRSSRFGVWELDVATNRLTWDDRMFEIYEIHRDTFDGSRDFWRTCVHSEDFAGLHDLSQRVLAGEQPAYDTEFRIVRPDGTVRHIEAHAYLQRDAEGRAVRFVGLNRDITAEKKMDEALALAEQRLQLAIEGSNDAVWDWNLETGVLFHDSRWALMLGYEPGEIAHTLEGWKHLVHPDDLAANDRVQQAHFEQRTPSYQHELRMRAKNGEWKWILDRGKVVRRAPDGRPLRMAGTHSDVTARRLLENRLRSAEELSDQVSRLALIGGWEFDPVTSQFTWSDGLRRIHEVDATFLPTVDHALSFYAPAEQDLLRAALEEARLHGSPIDLELPLTTARGRSLWVRVLGQAELDHGQIVRLHGAMQDITLQHESEGTRRGLEHQLFQAQKMETLGTLAGGIAHDFNNLLTGIIGYHELAADCLPEDNPARAALAEARHASLRARELVEQILTFGRQSTGMEHSPLDLTIVLDEARRFLRATLPATIAIELRPVPDGCHVLGDATQLNQVLLNLGSNAAHAMRDHGGTLTIAVTPAPIDPEPDSPLAGLAPGAYVCLTVTDTGHGMDEATRRRIFDPFFTTKNTREGTGLGLAVVHGIIRSHHGSITVDSTPGVGTTFTLYLPAAVTADLADDGVLTRAPGGTGELVCIVDDEEIVGNCTKLVLENQGYQAIFFTSAELCLSELAGHPQSCALLLTDQTMPGMQGTELVATLRRLHPTLPVVIMSGYFSKISPATLEELGQIELLAKPFTTEELTHTVHRALHPAKT